MRRCCSVVTIACGRLRCGGSRTKASESDHLADGLADSLTDALGNIRDVRVIPRAPRCNSSLRGRKFRFWRPNSWARMHFCVVRFRCKAPRFPVTLRLLAVDSGFQLFLPSLGAAVW